MPHSPIKPKFKANMCVTVFQEEISFFRWHKFCTALWGDVAVCSNKGLGVKRHLVPKYRYNITTLKRICSCMFLFQQHL